jgi:hypothetical protein
MFSESQIVKIPKEYHSKKLGNLNLSRVNKRPHTSAALDKTTLLTEYAFRILVSKKEKCLI